MEEQIHKVLDFFKGCTLTIITREKITSRLESLIATEVERRIQEITREAWFEGMKQCITFTHEDRNRKLRASKRMTFDDWLRSRLTENKQEGSSSEKPNNLQEGEKPKSGKPVCPNCKTSAFVDSAGYNSWGCNKCDSTWMNGGKAWEGGEQ